jgi:hypothetical protein
MTNTERHRAAASAARRRGELHRAEGNRRVGRAIGARHSLAPRTGGRAWVNGAEVGGANARYAHLSVSHD